MALQNWPLENVHNPLFLLTFASILGWHSISREASRLQDIRLLKSTEVQLNASCHWDSIVSRSSPVIGWASAIVKESITQLPDGQLSEGQQD